MNLHRFDVKTIKNVELRRKTFKTTQNYESDQIIMNCIDWSSKRSKKLSNVPKLQTRSNYDKFASIWRQNYQNVEVLRKTFKTTQNYKTDQITMNCIDLMSKRSKNAKLQKESNYDKFASIWRQNYQNVEVLRKTFKTTQNYKTDQITLNCIDWSSKRSKK